MNALALIQRFATATGFPVPTLAYASTSSDVQQVIELLNQEGRSLASRHDWQALTFETSFATLATESQGTLSSIIGATQVLKKIVNDTLYNRTTMQKVRGPLSKMVWGAYKNLTLTGPYPQYRIRGNNLILNPVPAAGQSVYFEFVSKCWCSDFAGANFRTNIGDDTDVVLINEDLLMAGLEWRWLRKKGLSYAEEFQSYEFLVKEAIGSDGMRPRLQMDGMAQDFKPGIFVSPGNWPL